MLSIVTRRGIACLALCLTLQNCSVDEAETPATSLHWDSARNLLLICIDTVRADVFYALGDAGRDALSAWEARGLVFTQAQAPAPWTVPTVASVFSGLWPIEHGAGAMDGDAPNIFEERPRAMHPGTPLLAEAAREQGFRTAAISASGWTFSKRNAIGLTRGFEEFDRVGTSPETLDVATMPTLVDMWRKRFAAHTPEARAFHFLHLMDAHNWHMVPEQRLDEIIGSFSQEELALYLEVAPPLACPSREYVICKRYLVYASAVQFLRDGMAALLDELQRGGALEETVVVLFSDHGEEFADHAEKGDPADKFSKRTNWGHGHTLYQEQLHVPLVVWHPAHGGARVDTPMSLIDVAPTAAHWLGIDFLPAGRDGILLDDYVAQPDALTGRVLFASHVNNGERQLSAREGDEKSIWYVPTDRSYYFDLARDAGELEPLDAPGLVLRFDGYFLEYSEYAPQRAAPHTELSAEEIKRLQSIGYLQGVETGGE